MTSPVSSVFIRRLENGFLVRVGLANERYFPDLKSAINHAGAGLAGPEEYASQSSGMAPEELEELVADDIVRKAWTISVCDPAYGGAADQLAEMMIRTDLRRRNLRGGHWGADHPPGAREARSETVARGEERGRAAAETEERW